MKTVKINWIIIQEFIRENLGWIFAFIFFVILLGQSRCSSETHKVEIAQRKKEIKANNKTIDSLKKINNAKDVVITKAEKKIEKNDKAIADLKIDFQKEKIKGEKQVAKVKDYNLRQWQSYYQELANCPDEQINIYGNTLAFNREPLVTISNVIISGQVAKAQQVITLEQLAKSQDNEKELKFVVTQEREKNENSQSMLDVEKETSKKWEKNFNDSQSDLKKAKRPLLVPVVLGVVAGTIVGVVIAK